MSEIEVDAAHVAAVAAALGAPPRHVFVVKYSDRHGDSLEVFLSKESARKALRYAVEARIEHWDQENKDERGVILLDTEPDSWSDENDTYYDIVCEPVQP